MTARYKHALLSILPLLLAGPAWAVPPALEPLNYQLRYDVYWNSVPLGRVRMDFEENQFGYKATVDTKTRGIASMFSSQKSIIEVEGRVDESGTAIARSYRSRSNGDDEPRETRLTFDEDGSLKSRTRKPEEDPGYRPPVPPEEANTATDPLTAFLRLRHALHEHIAQNIRDTLIRTYDGARLAEYNFRVVSRARLDRGDGYVDAINIVPKRTPINGYTPKELKKYKKGDPTMHVYFSADARFIPLQIDIDLAIGSLSAKLTEFKKKR